jgi:hypothetical protein
MSSPRLPLLPVEHSQLLPSLVKCTVEYIETVVVQWDYLLYVFFLLSIAAAPLKKSE